MAIDKSKGIVIKILTLNVMVGKLERAKKTLDPVDIQGVLDILYRCLDVQETMRWREAKQQCWQGYVNGNLTYNEMLRLRDRCDENIP